MSETKQEKTLADLVKDIYACRHFILAGTVLGCLCAAIWTLISTPYYKASMVVSPANPMNGAEISSLLADDNLFALRYLVQRVGVANSSDFLRFETIYDGVAVAGILVQQQDVMRGIADDRPFNVQQTPALNWSPEKLSDYIKNNVRFEPVNGSTLRKLSYHHPNPAFAKYFIAGIHQVSDAVIRRTVKEEASERTNYLQGQIAETRNPEHKRALTTLLMEQERLLMLASLDQPYAAAIVEPAAASHKPVWPNIPLLFSGLTILGAFFGFVFGSLRLALSAKAEQKPQSARTWFSQKNANRNQKGESEAYQERPLSGRAAE